MYIGEIAALLTAMCWVGSSVSFEYAGKKVGSLVLNLMRLVVSLVLITVLNFFITSGFQNLTITPEAFRALMLSGLIGLVLGDLFLFQAYIEIGARISLLIMALAPPITALFSYFLLDEVLGFGQILGMLVTVLGIAIVILGKEKGKKKLVVRHSVKGILYAFLGALGQAGGLILSKVGVKDLNPFVATEIRIFSGILGFILIITFFKSWPGFFQTFKLKSVMAGITVGSLFGPVVGVSLSLMAVKYTSTAIASTLMAITPILIIPVSVIFLKEKVKANEILGALVGVLGVAIIFLV
ncbi:DMT family transporter [Proteiniclasticum sp. BAD-10]|uniref:DMT family transporter n=1 Tax=Proteiniclasticum sediminis TaxID=2804028 RepID=A0A941HQ59_9CLOT|nr:DMT family transporter [Proteiniclasticum sediminis]MBR0576119.1 DMT family transporter [Proteiniclasticum sediminis]